MRPAVTCCQSKDLLTVIYGLPLKRKKLTDRVAGWETPAVVYPASVVGSLVSRADMESASHMRQSIQPAAGEPEVLSASMRVGWTRLAMMVDQSRRKRGGMISFLMTAVAGLACRPSGGHRKALTVELLAQPSVFT